MGAKRSKLIWTERRRCFPVIIAREVDVLPAEWRWRDGFGSHKNRFAGLRVRVDRFPNQPNRRTHTRSLRNLGLTAEISPELVSRLVGKKKPSSTIVTQRFSSLMRVYRTFPPVAPGIPF